jgi:hypothetical protein
MKMNEEVRKLQMYACRLGTLQYVACPRKMRKGKTLLFKKKKKKKHKVKGPCLCPFHQTVPLSRQGLPHLLLGQELLHLPAAVHELLDGLGQDAAVAARLPALGRGPRLPLLRLKLQLLAVGHQGWVLVVYH